MDDSSKVIYNPKTTEFTTADRIAKGINTMETADTVLYDFHRRFDPVDNSDYLIQDLGNIGPSLCLEFSTDVATSRRLGATSRRENRRFTGDQKKLFLDPTRANQGGGVV